MRTRRPFQVCLLVVACMLVQACAAKGPILINASYRATQAAVVTAPKAVIGLSSFKDERQAAASVVGHKLTASSEKGNDLVIQGTVKDLVARSFRDALAKHGIPVKSVPAWDLTDEDIPVNEADVVLGGEIEKFWAEVVSGTLNAKYNVSVRIRVTLADAAERRITRKLILNTSMDRKDVTFSAERMGDMLSEALSSSIDQLLNNEDFKKLVH